MDARAAREGVAHLARVDPRLGALIERVGPYALGADRGPDHFGALAQSIVYQQLAGKVAATIHARFLALFAEPPSPRAVAAVDVGALRAVGLSGAKTRALKDLALATGDGRLALPIDESMGDDEVVERLTTVTGVGPWTAHMFLMFQLERPDVLATGDLGVRRAVERAYGLEDLPSAADLTAMAEAWRPYRSAACRVLWWSLDNEPG